jgi:protein-tyrosine kinase
MIPEPLDSDALMDLDAELTDALIANCRLSPDQVASINAAKTEFQLDFGRAALRLDFVTPRELGTALAWARQLQSQRNSSLIESAIHRLTGDRNAPVVHAVTVKPGPQLIIAHDSNNVRSEELRSLRTELLMLLGDSTTGRALALLSPCAGEGRSQLAAEIAIAFSQLGRPTLLVDADLRHPRQHELFGADNDWGLAQALNFGQSPPLLGVEGLPQLSILTSGPVVPNPLEMLSDGRFERLLVKWRRHFQFVIIDTPPVTEFADGLAIATMAERVLVLSRANITSFSDMSELLRRLARTNSRILGGILNKF